MSIIQKSSIAKSSRKWSIRLLAQLGIVHKDIQSTAAIPLVERLKVSAAAFITLFLITFISQYVQNPEAAAILLASMGASAVIIFALPSSPLGKPWNFTCSHIMACLIGVGMTYIVTDLALMAGLTVAAILMLMYIFECIHPPAAATALVPVLASQNGPVGYDIIVAVGLNLTVFLLASFTLNRLLLHRTAPKMPQPYDAIHLHKDQSPLNRLGLQSDDLRHAISLFDSVLDVNEQDLEKFTNRLNSMRINDAVAKF